MKMKRRTDEQADTQRGAISPEDTETEIGTLNSFLHGKRSAEFSWQFLKLFALYELYYFEWKRKRRYTMLSEVLVLVRADWYRALWEPLYQ